MKLLKKGSWCFYGVRTLPIIFMLVGILSLSGTMAYSYSGKSITIVDENRTINILTHKNTVNKVLNQANISLNEKDGVSPNLETIITDNTQISINRAKNITLVVGGQAKKVATGKETVQEVLAEQQIVLGENDKLNINPTQKIIKDLVLKVIRVREAEVIEVEPIAFRINERKTTNISRGSKRVVQEGQNGQRRVMYKVVYEDDQIVSKEEVKQRILEKPVNAVVEVGVEPRVVVSRGADFRYTKEIYMSASAYTAGYESTRKRPGDRGYGRTATGMTAQRGVVAVDPTVIPLGTKLFVESADGYSSYGYAIAADTGGAIKGNKIDLFYDDLSDAVRFGRRTVKVYVLEN